MSTPRKIVPADVEIECYADTMSDDMPVYTGTPNDAFIGLEAGIYPGSYVETALAVPSGVQTMIQVNVILVVTADESFAVTTDQSYRGPMSVDVTDEINDGRML